ncbi:MAG: PKD domain-containing protein, partial [Methanosarcinaceae archaeon]|nr:PKD domain-containing protein [Methanosarcinaceae archaeon]
WYTFPHVTGPDATGPESIIEALRYWNTNVPLLPGDEGVDQKLEGYNTNVTFDHNLQNNDLNLTFDFKDNYSGINGIPTYATIRMVYCQQSNSISSDINIAEKDVGSFNPGGPVNHQTWYLFNRTVELDNLTDINDLLLGLKINANGNLNIKIDYLAIYLSNENGSEPASLMPVANFTSNITSGPAPLTVQFIDLSKNAEEWTWNFGDGTQITEQNPTHTYRDARNYTVSLTVKNGTNSDTKTSVKYIRVTLPESPVASFTANPTSGFAPLVVQFTDTSTGNPTSRAWDFDGDGITDSNEANPGYNYTSAGTYTASLTVGNSVDSSTATETITVEAGSTNGHGGRIILNKPDKGGKIFSGTYIEFENDYQTSYITYINEQNHPKNINLNKNDHIKLVMNGNQVVGEADMGINSISKYAFNVIIMRNGKEFGRGYITDIWIGGYSNFTSNLQYNIPPYTSGTSLIVDGNELISWYPANNSEINLCNIGPSPTTDNGFLRIDFNPYYTFIYCSGDYKIIG